MAYLGTDEILKLVDIDEKSVRLLEKISMSSEWPHMFLIKENKVFSYAPIKFPIDVKHPGYFFIKRPSNQIKYHVFPKKHFKIQLSLVK